MSISVFVYVWLFIFVAVCVCVCECVCVCLCVYKIVKQSTKTPSMCQTAIQMLIARWLCLDSQTGPLYKTRQVPGLHMLLWPHNLWLSVLCIKKTLSGKICTAVSLGLYLMFFLRTHHKVRWSALWKNTSKRGYSILRLLHYAMCLHFYGEWIELSSTSCTSTTHHHSIINHSLHTISLLFQTHSWHHISAVRPGEASGGYQSFLAGYF